MLDNLRKAATIHLEETFNMCYQRTNRNVEVKESNHSNLTHNDQKATKLITVKKNIYIQ